MQTEDELIRGGAVCGPMAGSRLGMNFRIQYTQEGIGSAGFCDMSLEKAWIGLYALLVWAKKSRSLARRAIRKITGRRRDGFETALPRRIPRKIWIYWDTGEATAPPVVKACIDSWRDLNPGWEVTVLDGDWIAASAGVIPPPGEHITVQAYSDLVRLRLLRRYGGVWVDATVICLKPLDDWLPPVARHGFFAFLWTEADKWFVLPNVHRIMTSWFLASEPEGAIIAPWEEKSFAYWDGRRKPHDYYWVHLILEYLRLTDRSVRRAFDAMPKLGAYAPHLVHDYVQGGRDKAAIRAALSSGAVPLQKLRWNWSAEELARAQEVLDILPASAPAPASVGGNG